MKYALLIYSDPAERPADNSPEAQEEWGAWMRISEEMAAVTRAGDPLHHATTATTVRVRDGEQILSDGPFAETKEVLGGFYVIDVPDLDTAVSWAAKLPNAPYGSVEVRPVYELAAG